MPITRVAGKHQSRGDSILMHSQHGVVHSPTGLVAVIMTGAVCTVSLQTTPEGFAAVHCLRLALEGISQLLAHWLV